LTGSMPVAQNHNQAAVDRHNECWRIRLHAQLDALCDDVEARRGYFGEVIFKIPYRDAKVTGFKTTVEQTVIS
jgi:hypothetical protein